MIKIFISITTFASACLFSQVAIGKTYITNNSVSLEFGEGNKGIVLPWVTSSTSIIGGVDGTIIYDITDKKVKYRKSGSWFDLSVDNDGSVVTDLQDSLTDKGSAKVAIGINGDTDTTPGILVLTDTDKAMILPKMVSPHLNLKNPAAGMMAFDNIKHPLTVFNGKVWTFWKP